MSGRGRPRRGREKDAKSRALDLLTRRAHSVRELRDKLARAGHEAGEIETALERLAELRLVDDRAVAYNHAQHRAREGKRARSWVRGELLRRGIDAELAEEALEDAFPPERANESFERAVRKLAGRRGVPEDREGRLRLARRLARAGFPSSQVNRILDENYELPEEDSGFFEDV